MSKCALTIKSPYIFVVESIRYSGNIFLVAITK